MRYIFYTVLLALISLFCYTKWEWDLGMVVWILVILSPVIALAIAGGISWVIHRRAISRWYALYGRGENEK